MTRETTKNPSLGNGRNPVELRLYSNNRKAREAELREYTLRREVVGDCRRRQQPGDASRRAGKREEKSA